VKATKWSDAADRDRDGGGHARKDSPIEQDPATSHLADIDQPPRVSISRSAPTEPQVTDVTPASTAGVLIGDHQRIIARMLGNPLARLLVKQHAKGIGHIAEYAPLTAGG
jgi:hypothetical protein